MDPMQSTYVKLLAFDLLSLSLKSSLSSSSSDPICFYRKGRPVLRTETLGVVVSRELKCNKFLKFLVDDGTGCIPCILWLNHHQSPYFSRHNPSDVKLLAEMAAKHASDVQLGVLVRVRGRITAYRGNLQITVSDVFIERDPNAEILHWLDCMKLASKCYDAPTHRIC
ncbi:CST complex subunit STN1 [Macadamia integrifolia]|uniref:CST complex subunit STN1 n=1 Tax=Macadamia integrifolia TaxID=60698 RepID=UPI001C4EC766|nr:CST complex subunit STN1 [Macadamia integrifolia]XP_042486888.1 CST complex subunit STN1 [Macadamia integrifolia]XP_042486889.1 CST complex subunit STN1 [Macadamia integrifolia]XP_042486890.1 CST complex subunit STN1 [Macadamia integrifolia]